MLWTQWSVVSSYPTAGNPPPATPPQKESTPQNAGKKKRDDEAKAKRKAKSQVNEVKELDPEEIAARKEVN